MDIIKNEKYQTYAFYEAKEVPVSDLKVLVTSFIDYSALNLGAKVEKADVDRIIEFVLDDFSYLPVYSLATAFFRGSLGKLKNDKTTLNPRNIYDWLSEIAADYRNKKEHDKRDKELSKDFVPFDLQNYPMGKAINWKIDHVKEDDWNRVSLKEVASIIGQGETPYLENFGIIYE